MIGRQISTPIKGYVAMNLFIFKSDFRKELRAFTNEGSGGKLPKRFGPWIGIGVVRTEKSPPYGLPRDVIEKAILDNGFQMWRIK